MTDHEAVIREALTNFATVSLIRDDEAFAALDALVARMEQAEADREGLFEAVTQAVAERDEWKREAYRLADVLPDGKT